MTNIESPYESGLGWPGDMVSVEETPLAGGPEVLPAIPEVTEADATIAALRAELEAQRQQNIDLRRLAYTDELTGLPNRRAIMETIDHLVETEPGSFVLMFIDLNDLKKANKQGYEYGDALIVDTAGTLMETAPQIILDPEDKQLIDTAQTVIHSSLRTEGDEEHPERPHDITGSNVGRLGGDEFLLLARGIRSEAEFTAVNNRVITNLRRAGINVSTGAAMHRPGLSRADLVKEANQAMDQDKTEQRARRQARERAALPAEKRAAHEAVEAERLKQGVDLDEHYLYYGISSRPPA